MQKIFGYIDYKKKHSIPMSLSSKIHVQSKKTTYNLHLNSSKDPLTSLFNKNDIFVYFLGNITNREKLLKELKLKDKYISNSKLIYKAFSIWEEQCFGKIEGTFSLLILNNKKERLYLVKDKIGLYPLFYFVSNESIIFGNSLKQFNQIESFHSEINPQGLALYLQFGYVMQPNTIFKDCYKIRAGEYISIDLKTQKKETKLYWSLESCYSQKKIEHDEKTIVKNAHRLLEEAIEKNLTSTNTAVSLSGGYDSSAVAAILQEQSDKKIETFTIGFENTKINEAPYAQTIANRLDTNHNAYCFSSKDAIELIPKLCYYYEEPFSEYAAAPTILTAHLAKEKNIENFFIGDGGDEVFATADDVEFFQRLQKTPQLLKRVMKRSFSKVDINKIPYLKDYNNLPTKYDKLCHMLTADSIPEMVQARSILFREQELIEQIKNYEKPIITTFKEIDFKGHQETVDEIIGTYFKTSMIDAELVKSYTAFQSVNLVPKVPFLDSKLIEYMATVPASIKIKNGTKKYLLKEIVHQYIPKQLMERPKMGFDIPFSAWMKDELKELLFTQINKKRLEEDNIFYTSSILKIRDDFYQGQEANKFKLWRIFLFQLWYEEYMKQTKTD